MVELTVSEPGKDAVCDWLWANGASAIVEEPAQNGLVLLRADLAADVAELVRSAELSEPRLRSVVEVKVRSGSDGIRSSAEIWRETARPVRFGRLLITPADPVAKAAPGEENDSTAGEQRVVGVFDRAVEPTSGSREASSPVVLLMDPGEAFGSGTHGTTQLCVEALSSIVRGGESVLDVGCGTGILGIAAALLGAVRVVALDIDSEALRVTRALAALNSVAERVEVTGAAPREVSGTFDLVLANMLIGSITELGGALVDRVSPAGRLVVSGILENQRERALTALHPLRPESESIRNGWLMMVLVP